MANFISQLYPSLICCPAGAISENGVCYCNRDQASSHPHACRVVCESLNSALPPSKGGCRCPDGYAGEFCDQKPCYVYSERSEDVKFYCGENFGSGSEDFKECNSLGIHIGTTDRNFTSIYSPCPCFNGATKIFQIFDTTKIHGCHCPEKYVGDLCHMEPFDASAADTTDPVTANAFLAIVAFVLLAITVVICCARRHQRRRNRTDADFHRHHVTLSEYRRRCRSTGFLDKYVPLFPVFVLNSQGFTVTRSGERSLKRKDVGNDAEEYPMQILTLKDPPAAERPNVTMICEDWPHEIIKKGPS